MKKIVSGLLAAAMILTAAASNTAFAADDGDDIVVFGDSIASGYGLGEGEYNYGELIADYIGGTVSNYASAGATTADTLAVIRNLNDAQKAELSDAEYVIISTGANDMIEYASTYMLNMCAEINALKPGYTADNLPEKPSFTDLTKIIDKEALKEYASNQANQFILAMRIQNIQKNIVINEKNDTFNEYDHLIESQIIPNINSMVSEIKAVNPDTKIIIQTIYNPLQFQKEYYDAAFTGSYASIMNLVKPVFGNCTKEYKTQLMAVDGIQTADVLNTFSSTEEIKGEYFTYGWYFTNIQNGKEDMDIHPTQAGHVAIASTVLNTMGKSKANGNKLRNCYLNLSNKDGYPKLALSELKNLIDLSSENSLGDIDNDNAVDSSDSSLVLGEYASLQASGKTTFTAAQSKAADINNDGAIDADDASMILKYYTYQSTTSGTVLDIEEWLKTV